ncbi:MAG: hypothetical protein GC201_15325 [Alphaproteobacteria bacterium]|nr:hypothetical protein [Alphaproteobacteria bacterium]
MSIRSCVATGSLCLIVALGTLTPLAGAHAQAHSAKSKEQPQPEYMQGQCRWTGTRVLHSLLREDTLAAQDHLKFYLQFGCPQDHLTKAFACAADAPTGANRPANEVLVSNCWEWLEPMGRPKEQANTVKKPDSKAAK